MLGSGFDATSLSQRYAFLNECPDSLFSVVVTLPIGTLSDRIAGVRAWYDALLVGRLPNSDGWPPGDICKPIRRAIETLGILRFTKGQPDVVDVLLKDILAAFSRQQSSFQSEVMRRLRELEEMERSRIAEARFAQAKRDKQRTQPVPLDPGLTERMLAQAESEFTARDRGVDSSLMSEWAERVRMWASIADIFGDLGEMMGRGWDLASTVLKHSGWQDLVRLRALLEQLPQLREIVRTLGRLHDSKTEESISETVFTPLRRLDEEMMEVRTPYVPSEMRGIERGDEIARMLPVEASMLGHPQLRLLWHARRAERALLTYRVEGIDIERQLVEREVFERSEPKRPRLERGPIIVVLDTSGSMRGMPETVAKALVLEALRTAHAERRRCLVFAFSGIGDVAEHELDLSPAGIAQLLAFLGFSFGGGTDIVGVMQMVVARLKDENWKRADVLLVSDGEWSPPAGLIASVDELRAGGNKFHGVLIGNHGHTGFDSLCNPVHEFRDWAIVGG